LILKSFAKINLFLEIIGKYENGFHIINSIMSHVDLYDEISIKEHDGLEVYFKGRFGHLILENNINILFKYLVHKNFIRNANYLIEIDKNIPVGAGLGGGSSNIATILNFLHENGIIKKEDKLSIARKMGSDIEFFLDKMAALSSGRGEIDKRFTIDSNNVLLLVYPNKVLSTKKVYSLNKKIDKKTSFDFKDSNSLELQEIMESTSNTLERSAIEICSEINKIKVALKSDKSCIYERMSGSGSCYYGVYKNWDDAEKAEKGLLDEHPDWWTCVTKLI
jgi:4-diphosphocytidyl-2-C-methyl-D-erythritol kinase